MAIAIASKSTRGYASGNVTITKPSGLEVGDLLVGVADCMFTASTLSNPAGWTSIISVDNATGNGHKINVAYKVADAADVAASDFTFTISGGAAQYGAGIIYRITGYNAANLVAGSASGTASPGSSLSFAGFTPSKANCLYLLAGGGTNNATSVSGYALATDNPTWTEDIDTNTADSSDATFACASASRAAATATGNASATFADTTLLQSCGVLVALAPSISFALADSLSLSEAAFSYVRKIVKALTETLSIIQLHKLALTETIISSDTYLRLKKGWQNLAKNTSNWTNTDKS